ncbi:MAG: hypothetical protein ABL308_07745 [Oceanicaulis sp.]
MARDSYGKLSFLKRGGSTSRVIDLVSIRERFGDTPGWAKRPLFRMSRLNRGFVVKHTLRAWERDQLGGDRTSATKVIIPISDRDLDLGGHSIFVESHDFEAKLSHHLGVTSDTPAFALDAQRLRQLAGLPSFDPYLLHEFFRREGADIDPCYFTISDGELAKITEFVAGQIDMLVRKAMGGSDLATREKSRRLAKVLFEDENSEQLVVLRDALRMTEKEYRDGVFGWKGTLYYSWRSSDCYADLTGFLRDLTSTRIVGLSDADRSEIRTVIASITQLSMGRWSRLKSRLDAYHTEFRRFVERGDPGALKTFMTRAPTLFVEMGEDIGRLQHVSSYWRFWTKDRRSRQMSGMEAFDLLPDFEAALQVTDHRDAA